MPENNSSDENLFLKKLEEEKLAMKNSSAKTEKKAKKPKRKIPGLALFATAFLTFLAIISLLIFTMSVGGAGNPVLQFFGQNEDTVKDFLIQLVNVSFGFLSVFLLLTIAITIFFGFSRKKEEIQKRSIAFAFSLVSLFLSFITIVMWLFMFNYVSSLQVHASSGESKIHMILSDGTDLTDPLTPEDTKNLEIPTNVTFSLEEVLQEFRSKGKTLDFIEWDFDNNKSYESAKTKESKQLYRLDRVGVITVNARLTATDGSEMIKSIVFEVPKGTFLASPETGPIPLSVGFDASVIKNPSGNTVVSYEWDFDGDNIVDETNSNPTITHEFDKIGTYTVWLNMVYRDGTIKRFSKKIVTTAAAPNVIQGKIKSSIPFTNESERVVEMFTDEEIILNAENFYSNSGNITRYEWSFSNSFYTRNGKTVTLNMDIPGEILVTLTVWDDKGNNTKENITIVVQKTPEKPHAKMRAKPAGGETIHNSTDITIGTTVDFTAKSSVAGEKEKITEYEWDFDGDGIVDDTGREVSHTYNNLGTQETILTVWNSAGEKDQISQFYAVRRQELTAVITADPENPRVPCNVHLDGSLSSCSNCKILGYTWDFGDGKKSNLTGAQVEHIYNSVGVFPVTLTVHTESEEATSIKNVFCRETAVRACFTASKITGSPPLKTTFNPECSTGTIANWKWDFGDGTQSPERLPTHIFNTTGTYTVNLTVIDNSGNTNTYESEIIVQ